MRKVLRVANGSLVQSNRAFRTGRDKNLMLPITAIDYRVAAPLPNW